MMYFWLIPLLLLVAVAVVFFFKGGTKRAAGPSRLEEAQDDQARGDLHK